MAEKTRRYNPQDDVFSLIDGKRVPVRGYDIKTAGKDASRAQSKPARQSAQPELSMEFDGQKLTLQVDDGHKIIRHSVPAVSGRPQDDGSFSYDKARQHMPDKGPLPEGTYPVNLQDLQYLKDVPAWNRVVGILSPAWAAVGGKKKGLFPGDKPAWGVGRIPIQTTAQQLKESGRTGGFFIHGGGTPGSAGCIDVVDRDRHFFDVVEKYRGAQTNIPLKVDYSKTPQKVRYGGK